MIEKTMSFWDHLEDLRAGLLRILALVTGLSFILFFLKGFLFDDLILAPSGGDFFLYRLAGVDFSLSLVNLEVTAQFMVHMKLTFVCALILSVPYIIYEIWRFIAPALYENERKAIGGAFVFASVLFYMGLAVAYCTVFPLMLNFFAGYQVSELVPNNFSLNSYISLFTSTMLVFGLVFEFPALMAVLSRLGVVTKQFLKKYRRHAICIVVILAAVITPSGDPFTLMVVSLPIYLLYELSILICKSEVIEKDDIN